MVTVIEVYILVLLFIELIGMERQGDGARDGETDVTKVHEE